MLDSSSHRDDNVLSSTTQYVKKRKAGEKQEAAVAYQLARALRNYDDVFIYNDVRIFHDGFNAQIDHLILYPAGFILLESKSINGKVAVNKQGEWSRSYNNQWQGMKSPVVQLDNQQDLLISHLNHHAPHLLKKSLGLQGYFTKRKYDLYAIVSDHANLYRTHIPNKINARIFKTEAVPKLVTGIIEQHRPSLWRHITSEVPLFAPEEMQNIAKHLTTLQHVEKPCEKQLNLMSQITASCGKCGSTKLSQPISGKYGYFVKCQGCAKTSSLSYPCPVCHGKTKVNKKQNTYTLTCEQGHKHMLVF